jgi:hypothetical protein
MEFKVYKYRPNPDFSGYRKKEDGDDDTMPQFFRQALIAKKKKRVN